jgi:hypothetical protein
VRQNGVSKINAAGLVTEYTVRATIPITAPPLGAKRLGSANRA